MGFNINIPQGKSNKKAGSSYGRECESAEKARNSQRRDTEPGLQKEGYLDVSNLDHLRRSKLYETV